MKHTNRKVTIKRKNARKKDEDKHLAQEACRGCKAVIGYVQRFEPEVRRRILAAAAVLCG